MCVQACGSRCFSDIRRLFTFFFSSSSFLSPFSFSTPHIPSLFWCPFCCPSFPFCHLSFLLHSSASHCSNSDCLLFLYFAPSELSVSPSSGSIHLSPPPAWVFCLSIFSSRAARAASLPVASGAAPVYTLRMRLQNGKSCKSRVKMTPQRAWSAWWQRTATAPRVII